VICIAGTDHEIILRKAREAAQPKPYQLTAPTTHTHTHAHTHTQSNQINHPVPPPHIIELLVNLPPDVDESSPVIPPLNSPGLIII
jgi:hypothetical protein